MDRQFVTVDGYNMAYHEVGEGRPIVFLHGNPTSAYLWRDVIPEVAKLGRCIAPDLIGMGHSDKLPNADVTTYTFATHAHFVDGFMAALELASDVVLVVHDWGSALGFDWANHHRDAVAGIAYMEGIVQPLASWSDFNPDATPLFQALRSDAGRELILEKNIFVERILPGSVLRDLTEEEMDVYRAPFLKPEDRFPTLTFPRQIPIEGDPPEVVARVQAYADWLAESDVPKLFVDAGPGAILIGKQRDFCRNWPNQTEVRVKGSHFIQEDSGPQIGAAIRDWLSGLST